VEEVREKVPELLEIVRDFISLLRSGKANPMELVLRRHLTKEADEYTNNSISAVVSKLVKEMGVPLAAGESIEFIIIDQSGKRRPEKAKPLALYAFEDGDDIEQYTEFALKAAETLLSPFGYDQQALKEELGLAAAQKKPSRPAQISRSRRSPAAKQIPLFRMRVHS
jgi:DNA polymerase elongation subunit (family B)